MNENEYTLPEDVLKNTIMANLPKSVKIKSISVKFKIKPKDKNNESTQEERELN